MIFDPLQLQDLTLRVLHLPNQAPPRVLPRFRTIKFRGAHGTNFPQFLRGVSMSRLKPVTINYGGITQSSTVLEQSRGASVTTGELSLSPVTSLSHSNITVICWFTDLIHLSISCVCEGPEQSGPRSFHPTDENIQDLVEALSRIRLLSLTPECSTPHGVTFASLVRLSRACDDLEVLAIRVLFREHHRWF